MKTMVLVAYEVSYDVSFAKLVPDKEIKLKNIINPCNAMGGRGFVGLMRTVF